MQIQPREGIGLHFQAKRPGTARRDGLADMRFDDRASFKGEPPEDYETLLLDVIAGGQTLFIRANQEEVAWSVLIPILLRAADTWGPEAVALLIARGGRSGLLPTVVMEGRKAAEASGE